MTDIAKKPIPEKTEKTAVFCYQTPNILLHAKDGLVHFVEGRSVQIPHTTRIWYSAQAENIERFVPGQLARFAIGDHTYNVLCDAGDYHGKPFGATKPTATEYQELIGTEVTTYFNCQKLPLQHCLKEWGIADVWKCGQVVVNLPKLQDE